MKNLYISDLDGTLLNSNSELSTFSKNAIKKLISNNIPFTISTARTPATITKILNDVHLSLPICAMNGACLYNLNTDTYEKAWLINKKSIEKIIDVFKENSLDAFFFNVDKHNLYTLCTKPTSIHSITYIKERKDSPKKIFIFKDSLDEIKDVDICFISCLDNKERIEKIANLIKDIEDINIYYYEDHIKKGVYFLEVSSSYAGKGNALNYIANKIQANKKIVFGDNINDIDLFKKADISYAVNNAHNTIKKLSNEIIESNNEDSVVKKILELEKIE